MAAKYTAKNTLIRRTATPKVGGHKGLENILFPRFSEQTLRGPQSFEKEVAWILNNLPRPWYK